ncbi:DUF4255 domain-containing protein [Specibacter cremeus]|uniref:DUF4255 domain-containing protein n=1 Tax=Specibacter cremeus TaxID=1629051 RepID=UPI0013DDBBBE|nr:DUF4255 domain-containing protein [Specibacter cremeus]
MSNTLAIAATTNAIRNLLQARLPALDTELSDLDVTTRTPDTARKGLAGTSVNLFLYETAVNLGWRNQDLPAQVHAGESGRPPLALDLRYLLTAYARDDADQDAVSHRVLAAAMSVLHDHPVLGADELAAALAGNDVGGQPERVRITPLRHGVEEISKLWTAFATNYRVSAAYEATVLLIDSRTPAASALPVLTRGAQDTGVRTLSGAAAVLTALTPADGQPAARLGETVTVAGTALAVADTVALFTALYRPPAGVPAPEPIELAPGVPSGAVGVTGTRLDVALPDQAHDATAWGRWTIGFHTVALVTAHPGQPALASNEAALALAPQITRTPTSVAAGGTLTLTCVPRIRPGQSVLAIIGDRQVVPASIVNPAPNDPNLDTTPTTLTVTVPAMDPGTYVVRLRVDGVDSIPVIRAGSPPLPSFDPAQQVTVP